MDDCCCDQHVPSLPTSLALPPRRCGPPSPPSSIYLHLHPAGLARTCNFRIIPGPNPDPNPAPNLSFNPSSGLACTHGIEDAFHSALEERHGRQMEGVWGSGLEGAPLEALSCGNIDAASQRVCTGEAKYVCSRCHLVAYCSQQCQKEHLHTHKVDCRSHLAAPVYVPRWVEERRRPGFITNEEG